MGHRPAEHVDLSGRFQWASGGLPAEDVAQLGHLGGGLGAVPGDVSDDQGQVITHLVDVVPIATGHGPHRRRDVAGRDIDVVGVGERGGDEPLAESFGQLAVLGERLAPLACGEHRIAGHQDREHEQGAEQDGARPECPLGAVEAVPGQGGLIGADRGDQLVDQFDAG